MKWAKYPLAILAKLLKVLPPRSAGGMDIACGFSKTAGNSSLALAINEKCHKFVVNMFHGYSYNYQCQLKNHPTITKGVRLKDFETMEHIFSLSNALACIIRYTSFYHCHLFIDIYFHQWDDDKYANLGTFILHNYQQALKILEEDTVAFEEAKLNLKISNDDLDTWEHEQAKYFTNIRQEPEEDCFKEGYVELLQSLDKAANNKAKANSAFLGHTGNSVFVAENPLSGQVQYNKAASKTLKLETQHHVACECYNNILQEVVKMKVQFQIHRR
ncbi:hypothetical protein QCA50_019998 [Cerrena zonata]|uniref:Uncharacterized protein n=1 Tax=Cerrena zonata TaxID=2478898 RepID=A0AAW0F8M3_9APHY